MDNFRRSGQVDSVPSLIEVARRADCSFRSIRRNPPHSTERAHAGEFEPAVGRVAVVAPPVPDPVAAQGDPHPMAGRPDGTGTAVPRPADCARGRGRRRCSRHGALPRGRRGRPVLSRWAIRLVASYPQVLDTVVGHVAHRGAAMPESRPGCRAPVDAGAPVARGITRAGTGRVTATKGAGTGGAGRRAAGVPPRPSLRRSRPRRRSAPRSPAGSRWCRRRSSCRCRPR